MLYILPKLLVYFNYRSAGLSWSFTPPAPTGNHAD